MRPTVGSLFSGIGGLELGLERAGFVTRWQVERDPYCVRVLEKHWPDVTRYGDITTVDWEDVERVDLICGGFPCQPFSIAGRRLAEEDERWVWPEVVRCLRVLRPHRVLLENVPGLLTSSFGRVAADLAACGYDFEWDCLPAAAVGAPHLRDRVFIVAWQRTELGWSVADPDYRRSCDAVRSGRDAAGDGSADVAHSDDPRPGGRCSEPDRGTVPRCSGETRDVADPNSERPEGGRLPEGAGRQAVSRVFGAAVRPERVWAPEPDVGRVAHGVPARVDRLRSLGNAVVPQVAEFIGRQLLAALPVLGGTTP